MNALTTIGIGLLGVVVGSIGSIVAQYLQHRLSKKQSIDSARRAIYSAWLHETFILEELLHSDYLARGGRPVTEEERSEYRTTVSWAEAHKRLEEVRMTATPAVELGATQILRYLKTSPQWVGDLTQNYDEWQLGFWEMRRAFINLARSEFGERTIDWHNNARYVRNMLPDSPVRQQYGTAQRQRRALPWAVGGTKSGEHN